MRLLIFNILSVFVNQGFIFIYMSKKSLERKNGIVEAICKPNENRHESITIGARAQLVLCYWIHLKTVWSAAASLLSLLSDTWRSFQGTFAAEFGSLIVCNHRSSQRRQITYVHVWWVPVSELGITIKTGCKNCTALMWFLLCCLPDNSSWNKITFISCRNVAQSA